MTAHEHHDVRETSGAVYQQIQDEGLLTGQHLLVYESFVEHGSMTARENDVRCGVGLRELGRSLQPAIHRLVQLGTLEERGKRKCTVTDREVLVYAVTGRLPVRRERVARPPKPNRVELGKALSELRKLLRHDLSLYHREPSEEMVKLGRWLVDQAQPRIRTVGTGDGESDIHDPEPTP